MDASRVVLIILLILFLILSPDGQRATPSQHRELQRLVASERDAIALLGKARYGDFDPMHERWVNVTGLKKEDGYTWSVFPEVQMKAREQFSAAFKRSGAKIEQDELTDASFMASAASEAISIRVPLYQNVTGIVHGQWVRSKIGLQQPSPALNLSALSPTRYTSTEFTRNITGATGDISFKLDEKKSEVLLEGPQSVREIKIEMTIEDQGSRGDGWEIALYGVHFPDRGSIVVSTTGEKFAGIFALPHFALTKSAFESSQRLLNQTLTSTVNRQEASALLPSYPWSSSSNNAADVMFPTPHCEYIVYLQQHLIDPSQRGAESSGFDSNTAAYLEQLEQELRFPTGAPLGYIPSLRFSATIFSPDCGFVLESKGPPDFAKNEGNHLIGIKAEAFHRRLRRAVYAYALLMALQIYLLVRQMQDASTPSTRSRVSYYSIAIMALGDGFIFLALMVLSLTMHALFLTIIATAFLAFLCVSFFGMKFLMDIWNVQAPERLERQRARDLERSQNSEPAAELSSLDSAPQSQVPRATNTNASAIPSATEWPSSVTANTESLPFPATTTQHTDGVDNPVIILPPDQDLDEEAAEDTADATPQTTAQTTIGSARREMGAMYSKFYFLLFGILFLSLNATTWPSTIRTVYINTLSFLYLSFWVPQIRRNVLRNCRKAFRWNFVFGQSVTRLVPFIYFYVGKDNVFFTKPDPYTLSVFICWQWIQVLLLISQEILGPRFFVPAGWAPPAYDYHPLLRESDEESGVLMPIGFMQAASSDGPPSSTPGEAKEKGKKVFDCAICMQNIEVTVVPPSDRDNETNSAASIGANIFSRRAYMVTPCRHIFHSPCLEGWMRYKLQCPICRETLPPL